MNLIGQVRRNAFATGVSFAAYALVGLWLTPYLIEKLGIVAYGMVPLAGVLTQFIAVVSTSISSSVSRFITVELHRDGGSPNAVFSTALAIVAAICLTQLPLFAAIVWNATLLFTIPEELTRDVLRLLGFSAAAFVVSLASGPFSVATFAKNRLDLSKSIDTTRVVARLVLIVIVFSALSPSLTAVGAIDFGLALLFFATHFILWLKLTPELSFRLSDVDFRRVKPLLSMSVWVLLTQLGFLLFNRTDLWIVNRLISPKASGEYAAVLQWSYLIRQVIGNLFSVTAPVVFAWYAKQEITRIAALARFSVRMAALAIAVPIALLCFYRDEVLRMWVGDAATGTMSGLMLITLLPLVLLLPFGVFFQVLQASDRMRSLGLLTVALGGANVAASVIGVTQFDGGVAAVALVSAVLLIIKNAVAVPLLCQSVIGLKVSSVLGELVPACVLATIVVAVSAIISRCFGGMDVRSLIVSAITSVLVGAPIAWCYALQGRDRELVLSVVTGRSSSA